MDDLVQLLLIWITKIPEWLTIVCHWLDIGSCLSCSVQDWRGIDCKFHNIKDFFFIVNEPKKESFIFFFFTKQLFFFTHNGFCGVFFFSIITSPSHHDHNLLCLPVSSSRPQHYLSTSYFSSTLVRSLLLSCWHHPSTSFSSLARLLKGRKESNSTSNLWLDAYFNIFLMIEVIIILRSWHSCMFICIFINRLIKNGKIFAVRLLTPVLTPPAGGTADHRVARSGPN